MRDIALSVKRNWKKKTRYSFMRVAWIIAAVIFLLDFFIKAYLRINFSFESIPVIKNVFHITVIFNSGGAFGILQGKTNLMILIGLVFIVFFFIFMKKEIKRNPASMIACGMILGGALSNLYDRILIGAVIDYIDIRIWPVFNLSDSCITLGVGILLWQTYRKKDNPC